MVGGAVVGGAVVVVVVVVVGGDPDAAAWAVVGDDAGHEHDRRPRRRRSPCREVVASRALTSFRGRPLVDGDPAGSAARGLVLDHRASG